MSKTYGKVIFWVVLALVLPFVMSDEYSLMVLTLCWIWAILASSLNLILGYTGQASLAQGAFFGIGAYASALLMLKAGLSFWSALPLCNFHYGRLRPLHRPYSPQDQRRLFCHCNLDVQHHRNHGDRSLVRAYRGSPRAHGNTVAFTHRTGGI